MRSSRTTASVLTLGVLVTAILGSAALPRRAAAWGWDGHRIVGYLAERNLTPRARAEVERLLGSEHDSLAEASVWADQVRPDPAYGWSGPHHYINAPDDATTFDMARDCPADRGCVVKAIEEHTATLRAGFASGARETEALLFLAHFVGDVHQPLHAAYGSDRGGNSVDVTFFGEPTNLHRVWDYMILDRDRKVFLWKRGWKRVARRLAASPRPAATDELDPLVWAGESFELARRRVYDLPADNVLGAAYAERGLPVIEERLLQAGLRLAALLNGLFAPSE